MWKTRTPIKTSFSLFRSPFALFCSFFFFFFFCCSLVVVLGWCGRWSVVEKGERYYPTLFFFRSDYLIFVLSRSFSLFFRQPPFFLFEKTWKKPRKSRHVKRVALIKLYPFHNTISNTYTHEVVVLCFEWYASLIKVRLRFIVLFFFFFFVVVRGRRRRRCVEKLILSFKISHRACVIIDTEHHHHHRARQSPRASHLTAKQPHDDDQPFFFMPRRFPLFLVKKRLFLRAVVLLLFCFRHHHHHQQQSVLRVSHRVFCIFFKKN